MVRNEEEEEEEGREEGREDGVTVRAMVRHTRTKPLEEEEENNSGSEEVLTTTSDRADALVRL